MIVFLHIAGLALVSANQEAIFPWHKKPAKTPPFDPKEFEAKVDRTVGKLLFENKLADHTLYSGVAGGNQFATIWVRDFCHATGGLLLKPSWRIGSRDVPSKQIVLSTLKEILSLIHDGQDDSKIKIPRALDSLGAHEDLLTFKVLKGGADLKKKVVWPFGEKDPGVGMQKFPHGKMYGYFKGEAGASETCDAGYLLILAFTRVAPLLNDTELTDFLQSSKDKLKKAIDFYSSAHRWETRNDKWYFNQTAWSEWKDSVKQEGISSYSNLQLVEALTKLIKLMKNDSRVAAALAEAKLFGPRFGSTGPQKLGDGSNGQYDALLGHLHDWTMDVYDYFHDNSTGLLRELDSHKDKELLKISHIDANLQWLETNEHSQEAQKLISLSKISEAFVQRNHGGGLRTLHGINALGWPQKEVSPGKSVIGLYQYHGTFAWSWWTCWFAEIAAKESNPELAQELLQFIWRTQYDSALGDQKFSNYISEVYSNTHIVHTIGYVSETPFLWGSSYCVRAIEALKQTQAATTATPAALEEEGQLKHEVNQVNNTALFENAEAESEPKQRLSRRFSLRSNAKLEATLQGSDEAMFLQEL